MSTFSAWWWVLTIVVWNHGIKNQSLLGNIMGISWKYHGNIYCLVVLSILKNDGVRQWDWDDIPYMKWIFFTKMFETTNQFSFGDISLMSDKSISFFSPLPLDPLKSSSWPVTHPKWSKTWWIPSDND